MKRHVSRFGFALFALLASAGSAQVQDGWNIARCQQALTDSKVRAGHACTVEHLRADLAQLMTAWDLGTIKPGDRVPGVLRADAEMGEVERAAGASTQDPFQFLKTFRCDFTESDGRRISTAGVTTRATRETFSDLVVDNVDYQQMTARFIGNAGSSPVVVFYGDMTVSFLEQTMTGNINLLSLFKSTARIDTYKAVYSRHNAFTTGDLAMTQSYGTCRALLAS